MGLTSRPLVHSYTDVAESAGTVIAFHAFLRMILLVWETRMGAATLLQAKRNTRSRLGFIGPRGKRDLIFIKNREEYISSSRDCITSGYSSETDHTQSRDLKRLPCLFAWPTIWIWGFAELWSLRAKDVQVRTSLDLDELLRWLSLELCWHWRSMCGLFVSAVSAGSAVHSAVTFIVNVNYFATFTAECVFYYLFKTLRTKCLCSILASSHVYWGYAAFKVDNTHTLYISHTHTKKKPLSTASAPPPLKIHFRLQNIWNSLRGGGLGEMNSD